LIIFCDYVKRLGKYCSNLKFITEFFNLIIYLFAFILEFFEDRHVLIICTTLEQLLEWTKCEHFQIDLSIKHVAGEIHEFKINYYNTEHNMSKLFFYIE